jgi:hypothetical protein
MTEEHETFEQAFDRESRVDSGGSGFHHPTGKPGTGWDAIPVYELASAFVDSLPDVVQSEDINDCTCIEHTEVEHLAEALQNFIAHVIASVIDAGSERDAVNESEGLRLALIHELDSWSNNPNHTQ